MLKGCHFKMIRSVYFLLPFLFTLTAPAMAAESIYTDLDLDHCQTIKEPAPEGEGPGDDVTMKCKGYKAYPIYFKEFDVRQSVLYGPVSKAYIDQAYETFGPFNHIGKKVEWRLNDAGKPFAAILRFHIENLNPESGSPDEAHQGQVLVISLVAQPDNPLSCVIGYVDALANPDANGLARDVADKLGQSFICGRDEPAFHGVKGEKSGGPMRNLPDPKAAK